MAVRWPEDRPWWRELVRRYATSPVPAARPPQRPCMVRIGVLFGPRAAAALGRPRRVRLEADGRPRTALRQFARPAELARLWVAELNASFVRAGVGARTVLAAAGLLRQEEHRPRTPNPHEALHDLQYGRVRDAGGALPPECWAARRRLNALMLVVDWGASARCGGWAPCAGPLHGAGCAPCVPVAVVDLRAALTRHAFAHEFGHLLGLPHTDVAAPGLPAVNVPSDGAGVMHAGGACRLEWMRPPQDASPRPWHHPQRDEAAWLGRALPALCRLRFRCAGACEGRCAGLAGRLVRSPGGADRDCRRGD